MKARVTCYLPSHHTDHVSVDEQEVYCQSGHIYDIAQDGVDLDELEDWQKGLTMDKLRVDILVDIKHCGFESSGYHQFEGENLISGIGTVNIIDVTVPGMNMEFYDIADENGAAEDYLLKLLESR